MGPSSVEGLAGRDGMAGGTYLGLSPGRGHHRTGCCGKDSWVETFGVCKDRPPGGAV